VNFRTQFALNFSAEIIVDYFAGGGGASTGLEIGLNRPVAVAKNHNPIALSMHEVNHPHARHLVTDVFDGDPDDECQGRPVGWFHMSPDCTHHSQARGGQPRKREIRNLSWIGLKWGGKKRPRVISLENVKQILDWGPLVAKRCPATGRVMKLDRSVAAPGERVPVQQQYLVPDPKRAGQTWRRFVALLRGMGYQVEWRVLCAADFGAPTTRTRLFMVARCDGRPIVWPEPTHAAEPFIVPIANWSRDGMQSASVPLSTVTAWPRGGQHALGAPTLIQTGYGERKGQAPRTLDLHAPLGTVVGDGKHALATAFLAQMNGGFNTTHAKDLREPVTTVTNTGSQQQLVTAFLARQFGASIGQGVDQPTPTTLAGGGGKTQLATAHLAHFRGNCDARSFADPLHTISAGGEHHGVVEYTLSPEHESSALRVAAFLIRYYSEGGQWGELQEPLATMTTKDRLALVTVTIAGTPYVIVDIGLRMLSPRELYRAQGFPDDYIIDRGHDGHRLTKSEQVFMCGNSVSPPPMAAIARANNPWADQLRAAA